MSDDMIGRVARAMCAAYGHDWHSYPVNEFWIKGARAAIEAMREPTLEMMRACNCTSRQIDCWQAIIDAALGEDQ
jgi:hypothetical protein